MATFVMLGKYSREALEGISADRTKSATDLIEKLGGKVQAMYATLGPSDLVLIVDLPGPEQAMQASVGLSRMTGIAFTTMPAVTVEQFDKLMTQQ